MKCWGRGILRKRGMYEGLGVGKSIKYSEICERINRVRIPRKKIEGFNVWIPREKIDSIQ